jgi:chemotaxis protein CheY-P-specific phosphatase CheC
MAFIATEPCGTADAPQDAVRIFIRFNGSRSGSLRMIAGEAFGVMLAANVLGTDPSDPDAVARGHDALKELVNITVGAMMPRLAVTPDDEFQFTIPQLEPLEQPGDWRAFVDRPGTQLLNCDGHVLAVALELGGS